ncbi:hypothetical protein IJ541_07130 [bacterium]|nr:hypothetical protein [bacterium]
MGKSKTRILRKGINNQIPKITRDEAIIKAANHLNDNNPIDAGSLITLFGLNAEEVLEAGASYESVVAMKNIFAK